MHLVVIHLVCVVHSSFKVTNRRATIGPSLLPDLIPYRDSVLTYLLREALGGNSKTTMIATIRPNKQYEEETLSTLRYATQARRVVNTVVVNENPYVRIIKEVDLPHAIYINVLQLKKQVTQLQSELKQQTPTLNTLRTQLTRVYKSSIEIQEMNNSINSAITSPFASPAILRYEGNVDSLRRRPLGSINHSATVMLLVR